MPSVVHVVEPFHAERNHRSAHPHRDSQKISVIVRGNQNENPSVDDSDAECLDFHRRF